MSKKSVLFVCLGNICRSPAAEGIFIDLVKQRNIFDDFQIDSAGTSGHHDGELADPRMRQAASSRGIDLVTRSRKFIARDLEKFDYIIAMDDSNYSNILNLDSSGQFSEKVIKMTDYTSDKFNSYDHVPDPYFGGAKGFEEVLDLLEDTCQNFLNSIT